MSTYSVTQIMSSKVQIVVSCFRHSRTSFFVKLCMFLIHLSIAIQSNYASTRQRYIFCLLDSRSTCQKIVHAINESFLLFLDVYFIKSLNSDSFKDNVITDDIISSYFCQNVRCQNWFCVLHLDLFVQFQFSL